jgi:hypothetical protein
MYNIKAVHPWPCDCIIMCPVLVRVPVDDIIAVQYTSVTSQGANGGSSTMNVIYIDRQPHSILRKAEVHVTGSHDQIKTWTDVLRRNIDRSKISAGYSGSLSFPPIGM